MIKSFKYADTQQLFETGKCRRSKNIEAVATRRLVQLDAAETIELLRSPPGNQLERLTGNRADGYSIRIKDQWRICFRWTDSGPDAVEIVNYH